MASTTPSVVVPNTATRSPVVMLEVVEGPLDPTTDVVAEKSTVTVVPVDVVTVNEVEVTDATVPVTAGGAGVLVPLLEPVPLPVPDGGPVGGSRQITVASTTPSVVVPNTATRSPVVMLEVVEGPLDPTTDVVAEKSTVTVVPVDVVTVNEVEVTDATVPVTAGGPAGGAGGLPSPEPLPDPDDPPPVPVGGGVGPEPDDPLVAEPDDPEPVADGGLGDPPPGLVVLVVEVEVLVYPLPVEPGPDTWPAWW